MELCFKKWNSPDFLVEIKAPHLDGLILGLGVAKELEELEEFDELDVLDELGEKNEVIDLVFLDDEGLGWLLRRFMIVSKITCSKDKSLEVSTQNIYLLTVR